MITSRRVRCLSQLNCWCGWTKRPYSYLERTVIMLDYMVKHGYSEYDQRYVALVKFSNTGDASIMQELFAGHGLKLDQVDIKTIQSLSDMMRASEKLVVVDMVIESHGSPDTDMVQALKLDHIACHGKFIPAFMAHYERLF